MRCSRLWVVPLDALKKGKIKETESGFYGICMLTGKGNRINLGSFVLFSLSAKLEHRMRVVCVCVSLAVCGIFISRFVEASFSIHHRSDSDPNAVT
ncbi:hypothetical protein RJT34_32108 [Clitoria ternatea]|uniref:Uncharacterized protein n=1 Tax=Clitoria ternatea TaxID=43366 RepID=A0AAN9EWS9_CLITE